MRMFRFGTTIGLAAITCALAFVFAFPVTVTADDASSLLTDTIANGTLTVLPAPEPLTPIRDVNPFKRAQDQIVTTGEAAGIDSAGRIEVLIGRFIQAALALVGVIFFVLMVYAGYLWMTAQGETEQLKRAKDTLKNAVIGLAITLAAYAVTAFVISRLIENALVG
ncbi:MAG: hypothetical protein V1723_04495 [Candidatus Uhrbacteria bacterium]